MEMLSRRRSGVREGARAGFWDGWRLHTAVITAYVLAAVYVTHRLWQDPNGRLLRNAQDHIFFEWIFAHGARVVFHGEYPFFTERLNSSAGVNLMANTSVLGVSLPLAPVTELFGPGVSVVLFLTLALAGTATAWYWVLRRHLVSSRTAAILGGAFCAFAPGMVSQADGHPNIVAQFVVPFIVARVLLLGRPGRRWLRDGLILGGLVVYQAFLNEEVLFFTALACLVVVLVAVAQNPSLLRRRGPDFLRGLGVGGLLAVVVLAYPLGVQFFGRQHYSGLWGTTDSADLAQYTAFGQATLAGNRVAAEISPRPEEETSFFGWPLVILVLLMLLVWWRNRTVQLLAVTGIVFFLLSLGSTIRLNREPTIHGIWGALEHLPLFDAVVTIRFALVVTTVIGVLLAVVTDQVMTRSALTVGWLRRVPAAGLRAGWFVLLAAALVPILPLHLQPTDERPIPAFIADGTWRDYVADGQTLVSAPLPMAPKPDAMRWAAYQDLDFGLAGGYFLAPAGGVPGASATFGSPRRPTSDLFYAAAYQGRVPPIGEQERRQAAEDVAYWRAGVIVVDPALYHVNALRNLLDQLYGTGHLVGGLWVWDVG